VSALFIVVAVLAVGAVIAAQRRLDQRAAEAKASHHDRPAATSPAGIRAALQFPPPATLTGSEGREFVEFIVAARGGEGALWSPAEAGLAESRLLERYGTVPTIEALEAWYGTDAAHAAVTEALRAQAELQEALRKMGTITDRPGICHLCGRGSTARCPFGLARVRSETREWDSVLVSVLGTLLLGPLVGVGLISGPRRVRRGNLLRLELQVCPTCMEASRGRFRLGRLTVRHYAFHPWWATAHAYGFTEFVSESELAKWTCAPTAP
jgi:hypothetical protein